MTDRYSNLRRRTIAFRATLVTAGVLCFVAAAGSIFFKAFGISIPALRIAGGILLFKVAFDMLNVRRTRIKSTDEENLEASQKEDVAVFPLGVPLLAGPGSIASVLVLSDRVENFSQYASIFAGIGATCLVVYLVLREAVWVQKALGAIGINILSRLMGLVLAAMAMQFIIDGIHAAFPSLSVIH